MINAADNFNLHCLALMLLQTCIRHIQHRHLDSCKGLILSVAKKTNRMTSIYSCSTVQWSNMLMDKYAKTGVLRSNLLKETLLSLCISDVLRSYDVHIFAIFCLQMYFNTTVINPWFISDCPVGKILELLNNLAYCHYLLHQYTCAWYLHKMNYNVSTVNRIFHTDMSFKTYHYVVILICLVNMQLCVQLCNYATT